MASTNTGSQAGKIVEEFAVLYEVEDEFDELIERYTEDPDFGLKDFESGLQRLLVYDWLVPNVLEEPDEINSASEKIAIILGDILNSGSDFVGLTTSSPITLDGYRGVDWHEVVSLFESPEDLDSGFRQRLKDELNQRINKASDDSHDTDYISTVNVAYLSEHFEKETPSYESVRNYFKNFTDIETGRSTLSSSGAVTREAKLVGRSEAVLTDLVEQLERNDLINTDSEDVEVLVNVRYLIDGNKYTLEELLQRADDSTNSSNVS